MNDDPKTTQSGAFEAWWAEHLETSSRTHAQKDCARLAWEAREAEIQKLRATLNYVVPALNAMNDAERMASVRRVAIQEALR